MNRACIAALVVLMAVVSLPAQTTSWRPTVVAQHGMVAAGHPLAAAPTVFTHGEDERLARAVLSIVNRADFDRAAFQAWAARTRPARLPARPSASDLAGAQNVKNALSKLEVLLATGSEPSESVAAARDAVRAALKDLF